MSGGSKKQTVGYWYKPMFHVGLSKGPIDAFLEFRGADKVAWKGAQTASGTISINEPKLWGGEKDQGGIVGDIDLMFGEAAQAPNAYLLATLGDQIPAWRGLMTLVFKGGKFGAMNPNPQPTAYKIRKIKQGWDGGSAWYGAAAEITYITDGTRAPIADDTAWEMRGNTVYKIGAAAAAWFAPFHGYIDSLRIKRGVALHAQPSYAVPSAPFGDALSDPTYANNVLLQRFYTGSLSDEMGHAVTPVNGAALSTAQSRWGTHAAFFNGSNQYLSVEMGSQADLGNVWTMEAWVWLSSLGTGSNRRTIVGHNNGGASHENTWIAAGAQWLYLQRTGAVETVSVRQNIPPLPEVGRWAFVSICRDGAQYWIHQDGLLLTGGYGVAMNPAHVLYYSRTNAEMGREPTGNIDAASLTAAADTLSAEGFGICTTYDASQESVEEFEQRITRLIDGSFSRDPISGLWHLDLARGDYVLGDLPILADDDILEFREIPTALENVTNSVSVTYFDPELKETITTAPVQATALVAEFGEIHQTLEYLEIPTADLALRVAQRELNARVTPARAYELTCTRRPFAWRPSTYFRLQAPKRGIADLVCLLADKESGSLRSGAIRITATQDIYSMPAVAFAEAEAGVDTSPAQAPVAVAQQAAIEAPYITVHATLERAEFDALPADAGYLLTVAADPAVSVNYTLMVDAGAGYAEVTAGDWCPSGTVSAAATRTTTAITIAGGTRLDEVLVGSAALWDSEIVRVDAIDTGTGAVTVARGCADTVPAAHASGSRIWFFGGNEVFDPTEYAAAEVINAKLLTNTGSQQLGIASATAMPVTFAERMARPYPPGKVKIASADWPASVSGSFSVTWAHRNRVLQADQIVDTTAGSITPADNIRYGLRFRRTDTSAVLVERTDIGPPTATVTLTHTGDVSLEMWTIDDDGVSWQSHLHTFSYTPPASPTNTITATPYTPVFGGTIIDGGDLDA